MKILRALSLGCLLLVTACASAPTVETYSANTPQLDLRKYLNGNVDAWGMFVDRSGKADPLFEVKMNGTWQGNNGIVKEHFIYSDGHTQDRTWKMAFSDDHNFTGTADDVVGTATGSQNGNAANMKYILTVTTKDGDSYDMSLDDWLYQMNDDLVVNRNVMSKFGITVGELIISFRKK